MLGGGDALHKAIDGIRRQVSDAIAGGANLVILSDRYATAELAPIPALLAHRGGAPPPRARPRRARASASSSRPARRARCITSRCCSATAPARSTRTSRSTRSAISCATSCCPGLNERKAHQNYVKAAGKGILKVMSKMGISTVASYTGAQIFEAIGLARTVVDEYFTGTASRIEGVDLDVIASEVAARHQLAFPDRPEELAHRELPVGGEYQWRREGEYHLFNPETVFKLQHSTRTGRYDVFKEYSQLVDDQARRLATLRGLFELRDDVRAAGADRRGRAGRRHRQPLLDRRDVVRVDLEGGARDPRDRDEPPRRALEHRRGRRGRRPLRRSTPTATSGAARSSRSRRAASA